MEGARGMMAQHLFASQVARAPMGLHAQSMSGNKRSPTPLLNAVLVNGNNTGRTDWWPALVDAQIGDTAILAGQSFTAPGAYASQSFGRSLVGLSKEQLDQHVTQANGNYAFRAAVLRNVAQIHLKIAQMNVPGSSGNPTNMGNFVRHRKHIGLMAMGKSDPEALGTPTIRINGGNVGSTLGYYSAPAYGNLAISIHFYLYPERELYDEGNIFGIGGHWSSQAAIYELIGY